MNPEILLALENIVGSAYIFTDEATRKTYGHDETEDLSFPPHVVVKPANTEEVAQILRVSNIYKIPTTPIGARTGLSGGALSIYGGIAISMERFNKIIEIDEKNHQVTTEPGVITQVLQDAVKEKGLFYPPDPGSLNVCTIGGNVANNAGGLRGLKYGVTKNYVLGIEMILPNGELLKTGGKNMKDVAGYNLRDFIIGSEGTLGIVTKVLLKLIQQYPELLLAVEV